MQSALKSQRFKGWPREDLRIVAHTKRFLECLSGDPQFREELQRRPGKCRAIASSRGIHIDPMDVVCYWRDGFTVAIEDEELRATSVGRLWSDYSEHMRATVLSWNNEIQSTVGDTRFQGWIFRQRERYKGKFLDSDNHPFSIAAFELSKGCSLNCWFCALGAGKLEGIFSYTPENVDLWRGILRECTDLFGAATRSAVCYTGTEPFDNPDYTSFLDDFHDIVGVIPRTTTALALRDLGKTRELLLRTLPNCPVPAIPCRFSTLSVGELRKIHDAFSAEEMLLVSLRQQQKGSLESKVSSGKYRSLNRSNETHDDEKDIGMNPQSICCLTGFLVNMVDRTMKLISQCEASDHWPLGYRIHFECAFTTAEEFGAAVRKAIEECMPAGLRLNQVVSFRRDLSYERFANGFRLISPTMSHTADGSAIFGRVGDRIQEGDYTLARILDQAQDANEYAAVVQTVNALFHQGLLAEDIGHA